MMEEVGKLGHHPRVGLVYDDRMCKHFDPNDENHIEKPDRIKAIWANLKSKGITHRCLVMKAKEAEDRNIALVHKQKYVDLIKTSSSKIDSKRKKIASKFNDVYLNKGSSQSAYLAAGAVIQVAEKTAKGELDSAVAIVRPPGHHAEVDKAMGFCFFNNVAIAASVLINEKPELGISKILIVDWDVHHGNGTQKMFWEDPRVLVFNVHRHDSGKFFPRGNDGSHSMIGEGLGTGYNVNVPWEQGNCGDADYFAVWDHVLIPITKDFNPDMILISGGFDAAAGDTIGGCSVTPEGYSVMMKKLMAFARGRIIMALEGGYNLESLSKSVLACVEALLENKPIIGSSKAEASPMETTWHVIEAVRKELSRYWPMLGHELPKTHKRTSSSEIPWLRCSFLEIWTRDNRIFCPYRYNTLSIASGEGTHALDKEEDDQTTFKSGKQKTRPSKEAGEQGEGISRKKSKTSSQTKEFLDMYKVPIPKNLGKKDPALRSSGAEKEVVHASVLQTLTNERDVNAALSTEVAKLKASDALAKKENEELVKSSETAKAQFLEQIEKLTNDKETIQTQLREKAEELTRSQELFTTKLQVQTGELTTTREMADTQQLKIDELTKEKEATQIQMKSLAEKMSLLENHLSSVKQEVLQVRSETQDAINILSRDAVAKYAASYGLPAPEYSDDEDSAELRGDEGSE